jgi:hypothetical protein
MVASQWCDSYLTESKIDSEVEASTSRPVRAPAILRRYPRERGIFDFKHWKAQMQVAGTKMPGASRAFR